MLLDLDTLKTKKETEARTFLEQIKMEVTLPPIPFEEKAVEEVRVARGDIEWIPQGLTFKGKLEKLGPLHSGWWGQDPHFKDTETEGGWVLWTPSLLEGSVDKSKEQQDNFLEGLKTNGSFEPHMGTASELAYLIFLHFHRTQKRIPSDYAWTRSSTPYRDGHISLGHFGGVDGLWLTFWDTPDRAYHLGILPIWKPPK